jgi:hypothetical protein
MRVLGTIVAFVLALVVTASVVIFAVLSLAGPHGGVLPQSLHTAAFVLGWLIVVVVPVLAARSAWRRLARSRG